MIIWKIFWLLFLAICLSSTLKSCNGQLNEETEPLVAVKPCQTSGREPGRCIPLTACQPATGNVDLLSKNSCSLEANDNSGVCCSNISAPVLVPEKAVAAPTIAAPVPGPEISEQDIQKSGTKAIDAIEKISTLEDDIVKNEIVDKGFSDRNSAPEDLHSFINFAFPEALEAEKIGAINEKTSIDLQARFTFSSAFAASPALQRHVGPVCETSIVECPASKYRTIDGSCNNQVNKDWGKAFTAFSRMTNSRTTYADGISAPRIAKSGNPLPSCRIVTTDILQSKSKAHPYANTLFMSFGQFVDHDLSLTPTKKVNVSGSFRDPPCCNVEDRHPECFPIEIPKNDSFYQTFNLECMEFVRSMVAGKCNLGPRQQQNQLTSFLDASMIYGILDRISNALRSHQNGKLRADVIGREFPPHKNSGPCIGNLGRGLLCIETGDTRAFEQPLLSLLHIIFLREHNRIANVLAKYHPEWDDEKLFQESRRIVIAIYQNIIYNEFLPILLGWNKMYEYNLILSKSGFKDKYDSFVDPSVMNEFATAAFRFGHSMVKGTIRLVFENGLVQNQQLLNHFLTPFNASLLDSYVRGAVLQRSEGIDSNVITELTNRLYQRGNRFGQDLAAINCQRGRDHGLLTYTQMRDHCFLEPVHSFKDLENFMDPAIARKFRSVYKSVEDIDLWTAGISERPEFGASVGPVFACIIGEQFKRLCQGDRFWFERGHTESSFTEAQLRQIRKASLARLFCDNTDIKSIQPLAFLPPSRWNPRLPCSNAKAIRRVFLSAWRHDT